MSDEYETHDSLPDETITSKDIQEHSDSHPDDSNQTEQPEHQPLLSKNAQKKKLKVERLAAIKVERRIRQKAVKKEKQRERKRHAELDDRNEDEDQPCSKRQRLVEPYGARVVVDLGFDDKMTDKEIVSLCSQLAYVYSTNRRSDRPFSSVIFTSLNGRTFQRLESLSEAGYRRWTGTEWWEQGYDRLWKQAEDEEGSASCTNSHLTEKTKVVYLTADAQEELLELKEDEIYIIGGICDHNRYKNLCENKAKADGIRSARLPIGKYIADMPTRKVITVNQTFEILLQWIDTQDWEKALYNVIPRRKFQK